MTRPDLDAILARLAKISPGTWELVEIVIHKRVEHWVAAGSHALWNEHGDVGIDDGDFIARAPADLRACVDALGEAWTENAKLRERLQLSQNAAMNLDADVAEARQRIERLELLAKGYDARADEQQNTLYESVLFRNVAHAIREQLARPETAASREQDAT